MTRPFCKKRIRFSPACRGLKPVGQAGQAQEPIYISPAEVESLRLKNIEELDQTTAAERMGVSQSTFQRLLAIAHRKTSEALIEGRELKIADQ